MRKRLHRRLTGPWPLRVRLTVAVASATAVVLALIGAVVYAQFVRGLDSRTDLELRERAITITEFAENVPERRLLDLSGESLAQLFGPAGDLRGSTPVLGRARLLSPAQVESARDEPRLTTRNAVAGVDDGARVIAFPVRDGAVFAIGEGRDRREHELGRIGVLLALGLPAALLLAAFAGYQVAGAALRPVELIRAQAARIGETESGRRLPQPGTGDELDRLTSTLNDLLARLEAALERERRIVSDASHELRTPISVLRTRLDVALRGEPEPEELRAVLDETQGDVRRLARMADDLLVLARIDQGRLPLRPEPVEVQDLLEQAAVRHAGDAAKRGREVEVAIEIRGGAVVLADPDRLAQILDNLIVNALAYGAGSISLVARMQTPNVVELSVSDHGHGFAEDLLPRAFERFAQGSDDGRGHGAGLGLAIVAALAKALGGSTSANNRPGGGGEVTVSLPVA